MLKVEKVRCGTSIPSLSGTGRRIFCSTGGVEGLNCKRPIPICRLFFKIDLLTDIAALCLTDFIDCRYIHSWVGIFDPACELLPPWTKELYLCTVAPTGRQPPPLSSVLYRIISERRSVLAAQLLLREKSGA
jgi:hypothetical protein